MDTYSFLRELADSWVLAALFAFFVGAVAWLWRPGSRPLHGAAGMLPFRHEDAPPPMLPSLESAPCGNACEGCTCGGARA